MPFALFVAIWCLGSLAVAQPVPTSSISIPAEEFINEQFCYTADVSLSGDPGYGPYLRIMVPPGATVNSIQFLGSSLSFTKIGAFPSGTIALEDPISKDSVRATDGAEAGDTLFVANLPVGSVVATTPDLTVSICATFNDGATLDSNYTFKVQPALEFGDTPSGTNGPISGTTVTGQSKPILLQFTKTNNAPENERPPGPDWPYQYTVVVDVANAKTLTGLTFTDIIPFNVNYVGNLTITGGTGCSVNYTPGSRTISGTCTSVTGTTGAGEIQIQYEVYVQDILDETSCAKGEVINSAAFSGTYESMLVTPDSARDTLEVEHLSIQTSASPSSLLPDDTITYTTVFQVTDFDSAAGNLNPVNSFILQEILPGGVSFISDVNPTITLSGGTTLGATTITPVVDTISGDTVRVTFDIHAVTGDIAAGTSGTLTYKALVRQTYDFAGSNPLLARDNLSKTVVGTYDLSGKVSGCTDNSSASVSIIYQTPSLTVFNDPDNSACYVPREVVTFKLTLVVPSGDTEGIIFDNFFPLPVFDVSDLDTDNFGTGFDIRLAPDHTDLSFVPSTANITKNTSQNSVRIEWPNLDGATASKTLSVYIDLPIDYQPFDDSLFLSNIFQYQTQNSSGNTDDSLLIVNLNLCTPDLAVVKGVSSTTGNGTLDPSPVQNPVNSDINNVEAGDEVTFVITTINNGGAKAYDVNVRDSIPQGVENCALATTNPLKYGDGTVLGVSEYSGNPFDAGGLTIDSLFASGDGSRRDTVTVTCTCDISSNIPPDTTFFNYGKTKWRSAPVAEQPDANQFSQIQDSVSLKSSRPSLTKSLIAISPNGSANNDIVVPGDTVTYQLDVTLSEGTTPALVISDTLPEGFLYVTGSVAVDDAGFTGTVTGTPSVSSSGDGTSGNAQTVAFSFGNTLTTSNNNNTDNSFSVTLKAVVLNNSANDGATTLQSKTNIAEITYTGVESPAINASDQTDLGEPDVAISLDITPGTGSDGGDVLTFTITLDNNGTTPAYDLTVTDNLDGLDNFLDLTSVINTTASLGDWSFSDIAGTVTFSLTGGDSLQAGGQQIFTFTVELDDNVTPNTTYQNEVSVTGTSNPGTPPQERSTTANATDNITTTLPAVAKSLQAVSPDGSATTGTNVTVGDTLIYNLDVTLTEGTTTNLIVTDNLPAGFEYVTYNVVTGTFNGSVSTSPSVGTSGTVGTGQTVSLTFSGNTTTTGDNNPANNTFRVELTALVADDNANDAENALQNKNNEVIVSSSSVSSGTVTANFAIDFAEPRVTINKSIDQDTLDAGDTLLVSLRIRNRGTGIGHDVVATDTLDGDLFDLASVVLVDAVGYTYSYSSPVVKFTLDTIAVDANDVVSFKVAVKNGVITGTTFQNQGIVTASTQAGTPTIERSNTRQNTETIYTRGVPVMEKTLLSSTDVNTENTQASIGEVLTYQIAITFPEGLTKENGTDPLVTDTLPVGFQYFSSPSQSARISAVADFNGGEIITSLAGTVNGTPVAITPTISGTVGTGQILGFDIGDVTNNDDQVTNDTDAEQLIITYEALVLNTTDNNAGNSKSNVVSLQYQDGDGNALNSKDTVTLTLQEPDLGMSTTLAPAGGDASGMEVVTITTKFFNSNSSNATTAYDLAFSDDLPDGFLGTGAGANAPAIVSATYTGDGSDISACFEFGGDGNELIFDASNGGCTLDSLDPGDTLIMVYTAVIDSLTDFNETLTTNPSGQGTSQDGATGNTSTGGNTAGTADADDGERTGSASNNTSGQAVNDLNATASDNFTLVEPSLTKTGDTNLAIGDSTTMTVTVALPGGTAESFVITDDLPAGLKYTGENVSITLPSGVFADTPSPSTTADDDPVIWNFGTVTNTNSTSQNLIISYEVEVRNLIGNQNATDLTNTATLTYTGSSGSANLSDEATVTVIEPNLTIEIEDGGGSYGAGSTIPYTIRIINDDNGATAYGVDFSSIIPAELLGGSSPFYDNIVLINTDGSVVLTGTGTAIAAGDVTLGTSINTGDLLSLADFDIPSGDTLTITFDATVISDAVAGASFVINASGDYNSLLSNDSRGRDNSTNPGTVDDDVNIDLNNYEESGTVTTTLTATVAIVKELNSSFSNNDFTIGDDIIYDIKVAIPEGVVNNVVIVDSLPAGLGFLSASRTGGVNMVFSSAMTNDGVVNSAGKIIFDLKNVTNTADADVTNDTLTLTLTVQVLDDGVEIVAGNTKDNEASVTTSVNTSAVVSNTVTIDIIEPNLSVSITPSNATPSLGEEVTFTVSIDNIGGATAHDIDLASVLKDLYLTYSGNFNANGSGFSIDASNIDSLVFSADNLAAGGNVSFTFTATVDSSATLDSAFSVSIGLTESYDSQDGTPSNPRVERSYNVTANTSLSPTLKGIDAKKTVTYNDANTNGQLDPLETLTYTVVLTNNTGAAAANVVFTDDLPANITYVSSSLSSSVGTTDDANAPILSVDVGTMTIGASVTITFQATVNGGTANGTLISNQGSVDSDQTEPEPTDLDGIDGNGDQPTDIIVGPRPSLVNDIYAQKVVEWLTDTDNSTDVTATDVMRYTFILENKGNAQLTNVSLTDAIPTGLSFSAAGTPTEGSLNTGSYPNITWSGITLDVGEVATVTLDVTIDAITGATATLTNQGSVDSDQTDPTSTDSNGDPTDGNQPTVFEAVNSGTASPNLDVEKRWVQTVDGDGDGLVDPTDTYRYSIVVTNTGSAPATDISFTDAAPTNTILTGDSVITSQGIVVTETSVSIEVNVGTLDPGGSAIITFEVSPTGASDGDLIPNQAAITSTNFNGGVAVNSDDNADDSDGINPTQTPVYTGSGPLDAGDLSKSLTGTSEGGSAGTNVLIGEVLTYELSIVVPKGNLSQAALIDTLPLGLRYVSSSATLTPTFNTSLNASENPGSVNGTSSGSAVSLTDGTDISIDGDTAIFVFLGDLINSDTDGTDESYVLSLQAVVANESGIGNDAGQSLTNKGNFSFIDGVSQNQTFAASSNPSVTIIESNVGLTKAGSSSWILTAGGEIEYTVTVSNPSGTNVATAYDVVVTDTLPFDADEWTSVSVQSSNGTGTTGAITNNSDLANGRLSFTIDSIPAGETFTLVFRASADGVPKLTLETDSMDNTAWVTTSSLPGTRGTGDATPGNSGAINGERTASGANADSDYLAQATAALTVLDLAFSKSILNAQTYYAIGDTIEYQLAIAVPDGVSSTNHVIQDAFPVGVAYISNSLLNAPGNNYPSGIVTDPGVDFTLSGSTADTLQLTLGSISNSTGSADTIRLTYWGIVSNVMTNQYNVSTTVGTELENFAQDQFSNPIDPDGPFTDTMTDSATTAVGEPHLAITNIIVGGDQVQGGTMNFSVTITNDGAGTAYDIIASDVATQYLENITNIVISASSGGVILPTGFTSDGTSWSTSEFTIPVGGSITVTFSADIAGNAPLGTNIAPNTVTATYSSQEGTSAAVERDGSDGGEQDNGVNLNNYNVEADPSATLTVFPIELLRFDARWKDDRQQDALIEWETATELNNNFFLVERSFNGVNWESIGQVQGAGTSTQPLGYSWTDQGIGFLATDSTIFYRLYQVDFDGTGSHSSTIELVVSQLTSRLLVKPNPFTDEFELILTGKLKMRNMILSDNRGREVLRYEGISPANGRKLTLGGLSYLAPGTYLLTVQLDNGERKTLKLRKRL